MDRSTKQRMAAALTASTRHKAAGHKEMFSRVRSKSATLSNTPEPVTVGIPRSSAEHARAKRDALMQLLQIGAIGIGGGVAGRSLIGLGRMFNSPAIHPAGGSVRPEIRVPPSAFNEEEKRAVSRTGPPGDMFQYFANMLPNISTTQELGDWWGPSAAVGAAGGGLIGGYALSDWLLDKERNTHRDSEVSESERDYQRALADEYRAAMMAKNAGDDLGVDDLFDALSAREKMAGWTDIVQTPYDIALGRDAVQQGKGWLLAAMMLTGAGTGYGMYNYTRSKNKSKILNQALQARARRRQMMSPAPPLAVTPPGLGEEDRAA